MREILLPKNPFTNSIRILAFLLCCMPLQSDAQVFDNILWVKTSINHSFNPKTSASFAPIFRLRDDISEYQDISFDYSAKRKLNSHFSVSLIGRTWFLRDGRKRQFVWPQISYSNSFEKLKLSSYLRWHHAFDINDVLDQDFLRWKLGLSFQTTDRLRLFVAAEPWYRLDGENKEIQRNRYSLGAGYKLSENTNLTLDWWRQTTSFDVDVTVNIFVVHLAYTI